VSAPHITNGRLTFEENGDAVFTQSRRVIADNHVSAIAARDFSDVPPPTATVAHSGALLVKNVVVHISLSTLSTESLGK
jgi:hypothetical protein